MQWTFTERVLQIVAAIPKGQTMSYKQVAMIAGSPNAARAVGSILKKNNCFEIPCHRVIKSDGTVGNYNGLRQKTKGQLLQEELQPNHQNQSNCSQ